MHEPCARPADAAALAAALALLVVVFAGRVARDAGHGVECRRPASYSVDLNAAGLEELTLLPGIGPGLAEAIREWRERSGPFRGIDDLMRVPGIGPARAEAIFRRAVLGDPESGSASTGAERGPDLGRHHQAGFE
jgi:competence ComEA-like helix-hairpin-helix protein